MTSSVFFGGSVVAAVVAGMIALFAPCCISVMLPAYFASAFHNRRMLVAMTFIYAAGVATIILPIAMGVSLLRQVIMGQHSVIYIGVGSLMLALAAYMLAGGQIHLPMPGRRAGGKTGVLSVYALGAFSGMATSCCAPVLAGVIALSSVAGAFGQVLALGLAYVFGMVAPLFVLSLLWERYNWRQSRLFRPRTIAWRIGPVRRTISGTNLAGGVLLVLIGASMIGFGLAYRSMPPLTGWQADMSVTVQHWGQILINGLAWLPNWAAAGLLVAVVALLAWRALRQMTPADDHEETAATCEPAKEESNEPQVIR